MQKLKISHYLEHSEVNGPGKRFVIWLQGCPFRCPGCFNADLQPIEGGSEYSIDAVLELILNTPGIEGVSFSGGEPFYQAGPLAKLARELQENHLSVFCYTGYTIDRIKSGGNPAHLELLEYIDILADGKYEKDRRPANNWVGSGNQQIYYLSTFYRPGKKELINTSEDFEVHIDEVGNISLTGFPAELFDKGDSD